MKSVWVFEIGSLWGTALRLHVTVLIVFGCLTLGLPFSESSQDGWLTVAFITALLVHETAHGIVAKLCKVPVNTLTVFPFGSVVSFSKVPHPLAQILTSIAGPATNILVVLSLIAEVNPLHALSLLLAGSFDSMTVAEKVVSVNAALALINLVPAMPLDGGRALRALLTLLSVQAPALVLSRVSQISCLATAVAAFLLSQPALLIAAFVIFFGALREHIRAEGHAAATAFTVLDVMVPISRLESFPHGTTVSAALKTILKSLQPFFPVMMNSTLVGFVFRDRILEHSALAPEAYLATIAEPPIEVVPPTASLVDALTTFDATGSPILVVKDGDDFLGVLVPERIAEFLIMKTLPRNPTDGDDVPWSIQM